MQLHPDVQALLDAMRALEGYLAGRDDFWAAHVRQAADEVARSDAHGLARFLSYFGGMGSLNDVVLHRDGVPLGWENVEFASLLRKATQCAEGLKRELQ